MRNDGELDAFLSARAKMDSPASLANGTAVGAWRITGFLARGGTAEVYCARRADDGAVAALKILHRADANAVSRFRREANFLSRNSLPNFPRFMGEGECDGRPFVAMELLEPVDLPRTDRDVAAFVRSLCRAIAPLHAQGLVHRDLKPSNVMRRRNGEIVIVDFGLLSSVSSPPTMVDGRIAASGTVGYGAPEQFEGGEISMAVDIHALGVISDVCFGHKPPKAWLGIIRRATSSIPARRFADADELSRAIARRHSVTRWLLALCALPLVAAAIMVIPSLSFGPDAAEPCVVADIPAAPPPPDDALYAVVDLSGGSQAARYPVEYLSAPPAAGWTDEYKTGKLVLRRIEENGRLRFFAGVFEVTRRQYDLVMGAGSPRASGGETLPATDVSMLDLRGDRFPIRIEDVAPESFFGRLRARTGMTFDLPNMPDMIYASAAGSTARFHFGDELDSDCAWVGLKEGGGRHPVGLKKPNAWGLYDTVGNVREWIRKRYWKMTFVMFGGCWSDDDPDLIFSERFHAAPNRRFGNCGFRAYLYPEFPSAEKVSAGASQIGSSRQYPLEVNLSKNEKGEIEK